VGLLLTGKPFSCDGKLELFPENRDLSKKETVRSSSDIKGFRLTNIYIEFSSFFSIEEKNQIN
jgi:hypothetical protein